MGESRNMDASFRLKEINSAREQIGESKYLSTDAAIKEAFEYGLCKELVLNNDYQNKLSEAKDIKEAFEKKVKKAEADLRRQKLAQIEADKAEIEAKRKEFQDKWRTAIIRYLKEDKIKNALNKVELESFGLLKRSPDGWRLVLFLSCAEELDGFTKGIKIVFKDNIGTLTSRNEEENIENDCDRGRMDFVFYAFQTVSKPDIAQSFNDLCPSGYCGTRGDAVSLDEVIVEMDLLITGVSRIDPPKDFIFNMPYVYGEYMPNEYGDMLDEPYPLKGLLR